MKDIDKEFDELLETDDIVELGRLQVLCMKSGSKKLTDKITKRFNEVLDKRQSRIDKVMDKLFPE